MKKYIPPILSGLAITLGLGVFVAHAQGYVPLAPLPGTTESASTSTVTTASYVSGMIKLLVALGGGLAVLFAIIGGTQYVAAGISPDAKSGAKERITNALIGLAIILTSYLLLNSISPRLVQFSISLRPVTVPVATVPPTGVSMTCPVTPLTPLTGKALEMENGATVIWEAGTENADPTTTNSNLAKTRAEVDKLNTALAGIGTSATVTSAYRPYTYQQHFYEIYTKWEGTGGTTVRLKDLNQTIWPGCVALQTEISAERTNHGLLGLVASPLGNAPHTVGTGVDLDLDETKIKYTDIDAFMTSKGVKLDWQNAPNDIVHFNYGTPK